MDGKPTTALFAGRYSIEPMDTGDIGEVLALWRGMPGIGLNDSDSPANLVRFLDRNAGLSLVARTTDDVIVAALLCSHDGRRGYLHHLAVDLDHRRRGLARELVERCLVALHREAIFKCNVFVYAHNADGQQFWKACGWGLRDDLTMLQRITADAVVAAR
jgi:ribosomal protein S18 acetylase RimI-like enzyme